MGINAINPNAIAQEVKANSAKSHPKGFNAFLGAASASKGVGDITGGVTAMSDATMLGVQQAGVGNNAQAVLAAAFSGTSAAGQVYGGSPYMTAGMGSSAMMSPSIAKYSSGVVGAGTSSVVAGTDFSQAEMINTMNQNNLQLLELQATMQSNMQAWNTKSNILSADHRARMAMIEKFTARG
ncbi:MAG: hypothetical protein ABH859_05240 [Pseudomonadota bacterium]